MFLALKRTPAQSATRVQRIFAALHAHAGQLGLRVGHADAFLRQVLHQVQVIRQLLVREALEQGQHPFAALGAQEVIGVFNAALDALQLLDLAQTQVVGELLCLVEADFCENGHENQR